MNFKNLIYSAIIVASLNLTDIAAHPLFVNNWKIPEHLTAKAREILALSPDVTHWTVPSNEFMELIMKLVEYDAKLNGLDKVTKKEWNKLKLKYYRSLKK